MAFAGTAGADDQDRRFLQQIPPGSQIMDQGPIQIRQTREIEALERLTGTESRAAHAQRKFLLVAARHLIMDQQGKKFGIGQLGFNRLAIARLQRIEDTGETQLLQIGGKFRNGIQKKLLQVEIGRWP